MDSIRSDLIKTASRVAVFFFGVRVRVSSARRKKKKKTHPSLSSSSSSFAWILRFSVMEMECMTEFPHTHMDRRPRKRPRLAWDVPKVLSRFYLDFLMYFCLFFMIWWSFVGYLIRSGKFLYFYHIFRCFVLFLLIWWFWSLSGEIWQWSALVFVRSSLFWCVSPEISCLYDCSHDC